MPGEYTHAKGRVLTPGDVAALFRVDPKTPVRWAAAGKLPAFKTPGGQTRFYENDVTALLADTGVSYDDPLRDYAEWVVSLDDPDPLSAGAKERRSITLHQIIERARYALNRLD